MPRKGPGLPNNLPPFSRRWGVLREEWPLAAQPPERLTVLCVTPGQPREKTCKHFALKKMRRFLRFLLAKIFILKYCFKVVKYKGVVARTSIFHSIPTNLDALPFGKKTCCCFNEISYAPVSPLLHLTVPAVGCLKVVAWPSWTKTGELLEIQQHPDASSFYWFLYYGIS